MSVSSGKNVFLNSKTGSLFVVDKVELVLGRISGKIKVSRDGGSTRKVKSITFNKNYISLGDL